jgi:putative transposase
MGTLSPAAGAQGHPARAPVVKIGRWEPTSQLCSACRHRAGPKPLSIRAWACPACGVVHDRDVNAARTILVAAGLAETQIACGGSLSPGQSLAVPVKQEPAEAPRERRGRNPAHGGEEVNTTSFAPPVRLGSRHR